MSVNPPQKIEEECFTVNMLVGTIWLSWFTIVGVLTFAIPCGMYHSAPDPPVGERVPPSARFDALHWMTTIAAIIIGIGCFVIPDTYMEENEQYHKRVRLCMFLIIGGSLLWIVTYCCYVILFFLSQDFKRSYETISYDEFVKLKASWLSATPEVWVYGKGVLHHRKSMPGDCIMDNPAILPAQDGEDFSEPLELTREQLGNLAIRVHTTVDVTYNSGADKFINNVKEQVKTCMLRSGDDISDIVTEAQGAVRGLKPYLLVTKDGKTPGTLKKARAGTAGFFAAGVVYFYDLARLSPVINYHMVKTANITKSTTVGCGSLGRCWYT